MIGLGRGNERLPGAEEAPSELRVGLIALVVAMAFLIFIARLFQLQILEGADLASRSHRNSVRTLRLEAPRGDIVDREGRPLATTRPAYRVRVIPNELRNAEREYRVLAEFLERDATELAEAVGTPRGRRRFQPVALENDLSYLQRAQVESHQYALPGIVTDMTPRRYYLGDESAAHLLGSIGEIDSKKLALDITPKYRAGDVVGKSGLESRHEAHLRGKLGGRNIVVDVAGREIEVLDEVEPTPGGRIVLTLDLDLQRSAEEAFRLVPGRRGALVAIDRYGPSADLNEASLELLKGLREGRGEGLRTREVWRSKQLEVGRAGAGVSAVFVEELIDFDERNGTLSVRPELATRGADPGALLRGLGVTHVLLVDRITGDGSSNLLAPELGETRTVWVTGPWREGCAPGEARLPHELHRAVRTLWSVERPGPRMELVELVGS